MHNCNVVRLFGGEDKSTDKRWSGVFLAALCTMVTCNAVAYDLPTVNLGATSFMDGAPPAGPGLYFTQYLQHYTSDRFTDANGNKLPLPKTDATLDVSLSQLSYVSNQDLLGGKLTFNAAVPWILNKDVDDGLNNAVLDGKRGIGDVTIGPGIQWGPVMGATGPVHAQRVEMLFILPIGEYDKTKAINPGSNFWSFNPNWAGTIWLNPNWTASWRLNYLWNAKNKDPGPAYGPGITSVRAGQAWHANFTTEYAVTPQLRLGINGYSLRQTTDTEFNGHAVSNRREKVWAIGPGGMYSFSQHDHIFLNAYFEHDAENRPEGSRLQVRWVHHFN